MSNLTVVDFDSIMSPTDRQRQAFKATDDHRFVLYGGAGGGGKSYFLRWWCLRQLLKLYAETGIEGIRVGLFSMDYPTLTDRQISRINREFPEWLGSLRKTQSDGYNFQVRTEFGGGTIALRNLDDPSKYRSAEFAAIAVEELTENSKETFDDLRFRLRWPGVNRPCFVGATNPGGVGHHWVKDFWIDGKFPKELQPFAQEFAYVPARVLDNPHITSDYYADLLSLPDAKRRALAEGDWSIPEGQYFTNFERGHRAIHPSILGQIIKPWWPKWIAQDWGFKHYSPVYWATTGDVMPEEAAMFGKAIDKPRKYVFIYREQITQMAAEGSDEETLAAKIVHRSQNEKIFRYFLSGDAFGQKSSQKTPAELIGNVLKAGGLPYPEKVDMSPGARVVGWRFIYQLIQNDVLMISEACPEALNAIPALQYDKDGPNTEDIQKVDHLYDDVGDTIRYLLQSMLNNKNKPFDVQLAEAIQAAPNATVANIVHMKMMAERKGKVRFTGR